MKTRSFIAIDPSEAALEAIGMFIKQVEKKTKGVRWVEAAGIHITLRFPGEIEEATLVQIKERLMEVATQSPSFELVTSGIGFFPHISRPRVVWVGLEGEVERLKQLHSAVAGSVAGLPVHPEEKREFQPHLTLGRIRDSRSFSGLVAIEEEGRRLRSEKFRVEELILYKSDLTPKGARYTKLSSFHLTGAIK